MALEDVGFAGFVQAALIVTLTAIPVLWQEAPRTQYAVYEVFVESAGVVKDAEVATVVAPCFHK